MSSSNESHYTPLVRRFLETGGPDAALIVSAAVLAEMELVGLGALSGPLTVKETAWILDPESFLETIGLVHEQVQRLVRAGLLVTPGQEPDCIRLDHVVRADQSLMTDFLAYLRRSAAVTDEEIRSLLNRGEK
jgi:hypothetical protein